MNRYLLLQQHDITHTKHTRNNTRFQERRKSIRALGINHASKAGKIEVFFKKQVRYTHAP